MKQIYISRLDIQERLNTRESFIGGRTNAVKLHCKVDIVKRFIIMILPVFTNGQTNIVNIP